MKRKPFIVLEGIEGSGKSSQIRMLADWLDDLGVPHLTTREPGGTAVGERIRQTVLHGTDLSIPPESELLLILAARAAFVREVVRPALERGTCVISDRFSWSTFAYQGYGRGLPLSQVRELNEFATGGLTPDLYLVLDVTVEEGLARQDLAGKVADRFEGEGRAFLDRVRAGYLAMLEGEGRGLLVDGSGEPGAVQRRIREALAGRFPETFSAGRV
jgi:dTMP kinase